MGPELRVFLGPGTFTANARELLGSGAVVGGGQEGASPMESTVYGEEVKAGSKGLKQLPWNHQGEVGLQWDHITVTCPIWGSGKVSCWPQCQETLQCLASLCVCVCEHQASPLVLLYSAEVRGFSALPWMGKGGERVCAALPFLPPLQGYALGFRPLCWGCWCGCWWGQSPCRAGGVLL